MFNRKKHPAPGDAAAGSAGGTAPDAPARGKMASPGPVVKDRPAAATVLKAGGSATSARPPKDPGTATRKLSPGQKIYEARQAEKNGMKLDQWMAEKNRRADADRVAAAEQSARTRRQDAKAKSPGLLRRLLDRAHRPL